MADLDFYTILPLTLLVVWACALLLVDLFIPKERKSLTALWRRLGWRSRLGLPWRRSDRKPRASAAWSSWMASRSSSMRCCCVSGLLGIALSFGYIKRMNLERGEYYTLMLFSITGMMLMAQAADLIVVFLALELLSIPLYVLAAFDRPSVESEEAGLKYFLLGAFATGFIVYGTALVFGATGTTSLSGIVAFIAPAAPSPSGASGVLLLTIGAALILVGLGFKVAAVPFHMWTPDVYQGAPTSVTAFMSAGAKIAGFAALLRVFATAFPSIAVDMTGVLWAVSAVTMILGNLVAISQTNIKRMLAYSSIAHAGYILMAFVPYGNPDVASRIHRCRALLPGCLCPDQLRHLGCGHRP